MTDERALQISNNVSEEFVDLGDVSFATKKELCETILWLNGHHLQDLQRKDQALDDILVRAAQTNLLVHVSPRQAKRVLLEIADIAAKARRYPCNEEMLGSRGPAACGYCGHPTTGDFSPNGATEEEWAAEASNHKPDCHWYKTRGRGIMA